jgi:hypothetical protein
LSAPNPDWARWILASTATYFTTALAPTPLFIEGQDRNTSALQSYLEFRMDGPYMREYTEGYWELTSEVNILIVTYINDNDLYLQQRLTGQVAGLFTQIPIYQLGDGDLSNPVYLECMTPYTTARDLIEISNFGKISPDSQMMQSTVESKYRMTLQI